MKKQGEGKNGPHIKKQKLQAIKEDAAEEFKPNLLESAKFHQKTVDVEEIEVETSGKKHAKQYSIDQGDVEV